MDITTAILYLISLISICIICVVLFIKLLNVKASLRELNNVHAKNIFHVAQLKRFVYFVDKYDEMTLRANNPDDIKHANRARKQFRELLDSSNICSIQPELKLASDAHYSYNYKKKCNFREVCFVSKEEFSKQTYQCRYRSDDNTNPFCKIDGLPVED